MRLLAALMLIGLLAIPGRTVVAQPSPVDEEATKRLQQMCDALAGAEQFSFRASIVETTPSGSGRLMHLRGRRAVSVARPGRLFVESSNGLHNHWLWFDEGQLTLINGLDGTTASVKGPATIDGMLDKLFAEHDVVMPLADLIYSDPYAGLGADLVAARFFGMVRMDGRQCYHLGFRREGLDWQVWIDAGDVPLPAKVLLTYTDEPGRPEFAATLTDWTLAPRFQDGLFTPVVPDDAKPVTIDEFVGQEVQP